MKLVKMMDMMMILLVVKPFIFYTNSFSLDIINKMSKSYG